MTWFVLIYFPIIRAFYLQNLGTWKPRPQDCGLKTILTNIIGGETTKLGEFPFMAILGFEQFNVANGVAYSCGGTLINKWYVLTAAHCFNDQKLK